MRKDVIYWFIFILLEIFLWRFSIVLVSLECIPANLIGLGLAFLAILAILVFFNNVVYKE